MKDIPMHYYCNSHVTMKMANQAIQGNLELLPLEGERDQFGHSSGFSQKMESLLRKKTSKKQGTLYWKYNEHSFSFTEQASQRIQQILKHQPELAM